MSVSGVAERIWRMLKPCLLAVETIDRPWTGRMSHNRASPHPTVMPSAVSADGHDEPRARPRPDSPRLQTIDPGLALPAHQLSEVTKSRQT